MVPRDFQALSARRAARADAVAVHRVEVVYAAVVRLQGRIASFLQPGDAAGVLLAARPWLVELVLETGPDLLREAAPGFDEAACRRALDCLPDAPAPHTFFAWALLQPWAAIAHPALGQPHLNRCPRCGQPPQVGCRRPVAEGTALSLVCSLCLAEWSFPRSTCPACSNTDARRISYYSTPEFDHIQVQACESCGRYFHAINLAKDPQAVPDADEIAALPLDVWAREQGLEKIHPNLVGI